MLAEPCSVLAELAFAALWRLALDPGRKGAAVAESAELCTASAKRSLVRRLRAGAAAVVVLVVVGGAMTGLVVLVLVLVFTVMGVAGRAEEVLLTVPVVA